MSYLEEAKKVTRAKGQFEPINKDHIELALAWVKDEVTISQVNIALSRTSTSSYSILARALKKHLQTHHD